MERLKEESFFLLLPYHSCCLFILASCLCACLSSPLQEGVQSPPTLKLCTYGWARKKSHEHLSLFFLLLLLLLHVATCSPANGRTGMAAVNKTTTAPRWRHSTARRVKRLFPSPSSSELCCDGVSHPGGHAAGRWRYWWASPADVSTRRAHT